jgi:DNA-binding NtrC family response regulator
MSKKTILVLDDEPEIGELLKEVFPKEGFSLITAVTVSLALKVLAEQKIDILLSDVTMPNGGARTILTWIQQHRPEIVVYLMSGDVELASDLVKQFKVVQIFEKPYDFPKMVKEITDHTS